MNSLGDLYQLCWCVYVEEENDQSPILSGVDATEPKRLFLNLLLVEA